MAYWTPNTATGTTQITITIPDDEFFLYAIRGALLELTESDNWEQHGMLTPDETVEAMLIAFDNMVIV